MQWIYLCLAIIFEVAGTTSMKLSEGLTKWQPSVLLVFFYICSLIFLTLTLKSLEVSLAYAIWSGLGIVIITLIGVFYFGESMNVAKMLSIALILIGVVTLNLAPEKTSHEKPTVSHSVKEE